MLQPAFGGVHALAPHQIRIAHPGHYRARAGNDRGIPPPVLLCLHPCVSIRWRDTGCKPENHKGPGEAVSDEPPRALPDGERSGSPGGVHYEVGLQFLAATLALFLALFRAAFRATFCAATPAADDQAPDPVLRPTGIRQPGILED